LRNAALFIRVYSNHHEANLDSALGIQYIKGPYAGKAKFNLETKILEAKFKGSYFRDIAKPLEMRSLKNDTTERDEYGAAVALAYNF